MALTSETRRSGPYAGNNSTVTPYVVGFYFLADSDLVVVVTTSAGVKSTLVLTTDYVVTGAGNEAGGSFTTLVAVPVTSTVVVYSRTPGTQTSEYIEADEFPAASHERALDKLTILVDEREDAAARAFRIKDSYAELAALTPVNDSLLGLSAGGVPVFQTAIEVLSWINAVTTVFNMPTKTWLDAAARASVVPDFIGQVGMQRDTFALYMGTAISAGSWTLALAGVADGAITTPKLIDGVLSADAAGRLKMAAAFLMASHLNKDAVSGQTAKTLLADADRLLGWSSADDALRYFAGNVVVPPGSVVQTQSGTYTLNTDITTVIPFDNTIPQIGEGTQLISVAITPRYADSLIECIISGFGRTNGPNAIVLPVFFDSITDAFHTHAVFSDSTVTSNCSFTAVLHAPLTAAAHTYSLRAGPATAGTLRMNGTTTGMLFGGVARVQLVVKEIKV